MNMIPPESRLRRVSRGVIALAGKVAFHRDAILENGRQGYIQISAGNYCYSPRHYWYTKTLARKVRRIRRALASL